MHVESTLELGEGTSQVAASGGEQAAAASRRRLPGRAFEPRRVVLEPGQVLLSFVELLACDERLDQIWNESGHAGLAQLLSARELDERAEDGDRLGVPAEGELEEPERRRREVLGGAAAGAARERECLHRRRAGAFFVAAVRVCKRAQRERVRDHRLLAPLLSAEDTLVRVSCSLVEPAAQAFGLREQHPDVRDRALIADLFGDREHLLESSLRSSSCSHHIRTTATWNSAPPIARVPRPTAPAAAAAASVA